MLDAVIVSDIHLGSNVCQAARFIKFLDNLPPTKRLIINGDLLEGKYDWLNAFHTTVIWRLGMLRLRTEVVWILGNHDYDYAKVEWALPGPVEEYQFGDYLVIHGDRWDDTLTGNKFTVRLAEWAYYMLQQVSLRLARYAKKRSKLMLHISDKVRTGALELAEQRNVRTVICGHVHEARLEARYVNTGCWVEDYVTYVTVKDDVVKLHELDWNCNEDTLTIAAPAGCPDYAG